VDVLQTILHEQKCFYIKKQLNLNSLNSLSSQTKYLSTNIPLIRRIPIRFDRMKESSVVFFPSCFLLPDLNVGFGQFRQSLCKMQIRMLCKLAPN